MKWEELSLEQQKRLQRAKDSLSNEEKSLRRELFYGDGWIDSFGHRQVFAPRKPPEKKEKKDDKNETNELHLP